MVEFIKDDPVMFWYIFKISYKLDRIYMSKGINSYWADRKDGFDNRVKYLLSNPNKFLGDNRKKYINPLRSSLPSWCNKDIPYHKNKFIFIKTQDEVIFKLWKEGLGV